MIYNPHNASSPLELYFIDRLKKLLRVDSIDVSASFLQNGGNSIQAIRLANQLQKELGILFPPLKLFETESIIDTIQYLDKTNPSLEKRISITGDTIKILSTAADELTQLTGSQLITMLGWEDLHDVKSPEEQINENSILFLLTSLYGGEEEMSQIFQGIENVFTLPVVHHLPFISYEQRERFLGKEYSTLLNKRLNSQLSSKWSISTGTYNREFNVTDSLDNKPVYFYKWLVKVEKSTTIVDTIPLTTLHTRFLSRLNTIFPNATFVHIVCNPEDMVKKYLKDSDNIFVRLYPTLDHEKFAQQLWELSTRNIMEFMSELPMRKQYRFTYDSIKENPSGFIRSLNSSLKLHQDNSHFLTDLDNESNEISENDDSVEQNESTIILNSRIKSLAESLNINFQSTVRSTVNRPLDSSEQIDSLSDDQIEEMYNREFGADEDSTL